ncbi:hypothetical protein SAMN05421821_105177 [Mucilaginibacter lappiensis]|uniref:Uncharacterized protein n=1 Tax=Mucilaginibacter lappiensis TaxID=354630 RepID=A0ABR6PJ07_9SPHI|nr:hypothetical protein [Mucilaginibacter lappiensis]MBB6109759.1 hypothetical protein [Mucilaginibacter lappiensis]SIR14577.1 hypothetical protein SAMN05421821_105177 [Mucilaginibacter lappiensis]
MQLPKFKIRASAASEILAGSIGLTDVQLAKRDELSNRKKAAETGEKGIKPLTPNMEAELEALNYKLNNPELPTGAKSYCEKWVKEKLYDRRKNFANKYLEKGIACEDDSIEFAAQSLGWGQVAKNEEWFSDEWMEGTPDIITELYRQEVVEDNNIIEMFTPTVIDMKNVWDCFTLPLFDDIIPNEAYKIQLQVYLHLVSIDYGIDFNDAILCYALMDAPLNVMEKEMRSLSWEEGHRGLITDEIRQRVHKEMTYSNLGPNLRLKIFTVKRDRAVIEELKIRVKMCRKYIDQLVENSKYILQAA